VTSVVPIGKTGARWWNPTLSRSNSVSSKWSCCLGTDPVHFGMVE